MKMLRLVASLTAAAMASCLVGCSNSRTVRILQDGTRVENSTYGLTPRAGELLDVGVRYKLRLPPAQPTPSGK
jgi:hypothetical protein